MMKLWGQFFYMNKEYGLYFEFKFGRMIDYSVFDCRNIFYLGSLYAEYVDIIDQYIEVRLFC